VSDRRDDRWTGRHVLVVGLGASGAAAARVLAGAGAVVRVTEASTSPAIEERAQSLSALGVEVEIGGHDLGRLDAEIAIVSPGIEPAADVVVASRRAGVEIISEIELAYRLASCDFLAVTGTNGKTTTTSLLAAMLSAASRPSVAAGNIGLPLVDAVMTIPPGGAIATEVSSFQLDAIKEFRARVAVMLNIAEDHTDWHGTMAAYTAAKARIVENQTSDDVFVFNCEDPRAATIANTAPGRVLPFSATRSPTDGIGVDGARIIYRGTAVIEVEDVPLPGRAGLEDAIAASGAALEYGIDASAVARAIKSFRPLRHRLELVGTYYDVSYIDDSKATNPHATLAAVGGMHDVVLVAGGRSKGIDLMPLASTVPPVTAVIAMGEAAEEVAKVFDDLVPVERVSNMHEAVAKARAHAIRSGTVLLSPGCASLDMYENYAERGEAFVRAVRDLAGVPRKGGHDGNA
jgi:UDP-N-acetylmuramoylalanine--D-glutamate ligase